MSQCFPGSQTKLAAFAAQKLRSGRFQHRRATNSLLTDIIPTKYPSLTVV